MISLIISLFLNVADASPEGQSSDYSISVKGPLATESFICNDPCRIDETLVIKQNSSDIAIGTNSKTEEVSKQVKCKGNCIKHDERMQVVLKTAPKLRRGLEITIVDGHAHFIFYSVAESENGPSTRRQHSEFRVDRPLIELELHDHDVVIKASIVR
jgi:hypothetical protein